MERLFSSQRSKMNYYYNKGVHNSVLCSEVVPFSNGPLSGGSTRLSNILFIKILNILSYSFFQSFVVAFPDLSEGLSVFLVLRLLV